MDLSAEKYLLFTTFKRDGTPVATPVWVVQLPSGEFGFWTSSGSGKAKRLAHTARVIVQPSDARGRVREGTSPIETTARVVTGAEHAQIQTAVRAKYGAVTHLTKVIGTLMQTMRGKRIPYGDVGVVISIPS